MADKAQDTASEGTSTAGGYLSSAASYIPGTEQAKNAVSGAPGKAQEGAGTASQGLKDVTAPVPVVGSVVEGVNEAPAVQKLTGQEKEKQGYLGAGYNTAAGAVRMVYDTAGNVIDTVSEKAGTYMHGTEKAKAEDEVDEASKVEAMKKDEEAIKQDTTAKTQKTADKTTDSAQETADITTSESKDTTSSLGQTASDTSNKLMEGHRDIEENAESGGKDAINTVQESTGIKDATSGASNGLSDTVDSAKGTARGVEDGVSHGVGSTAGRDTEGIKGGAEDTAGSVQEGTKGAVAGGRDTVTGTVGALGVR